MLFLRVGLLFSVVTGMGGAAWTDFMCCTGAKCEQLCVITISKLSL